MSQFDETSSEAWRARYGSEPPAALPDMGRLLHHRSVRDYSGRPIEQEVIQGLVAAGQSAATSSNLQLYSLISIQDADRRQQLAELCGDQKQITTAPWFFCFCADIHRLGFVANQAGESPNGLDTTEFFVMACVDTALAAERMVCAAESQGIGTCYIGALRNHPQKVAKILSLPAGVFGLFGLCLGWPTEDCAAEIKPRLGQKAIWFEEQYQLQYAKEYEARMAEFYAQQGMNSEIGWAARSGRRANLKAVGTRIELGPFVREQGFDLQ